MFRTRTDLSVRADRVDLAGAREPASIPPRRTWW